MPAPASHYGMDDCLEPAVVRPLLELALSAPARNPVTIHSVRVLSARRSASRHRNPVPLCLRYEAILRDDTTQAPHAVELYAKVYRDSASAQVACGEAAVLVPPLNMVVWCWPADPGLPQLPDLLDPAQTLRWWGEAAESVTALRYVPEHRATFCYTGRNAAGATRRLYAKTFKDERAALVNARFAYFDALAAADPWAPAVARPLGFCEHTRSFWQCEATGAPLLQSIALLPQPVLAQRLAYALAKLHAAPPHLAGSNLRDETHWREEIRRRRKKVSRVLPALEARVTRVAETLEAALVELGPFPRKLIHGDFHPEQVWVDGARPVLFDFDEFSRGDPMEDLAEFVTKLAPADPGGAFTACVVSAYAQYAPARFSHARLAWHRALQQLLQTSRAFVFQAAGWPVEVERRLSQTEALLFELRDRCVA